ncbi:MAG: 30S ribosomal protein S21, partial [Acidimicrobiales bacterium]|nr:30S ribosomal protein S21 [Acidimicrobiales bacterium]
ALAAVARDAAATARAVTPTASITVEVKSNESLEAALRRFKRQCNYGGIFRLAKANTWHEKRSDKNRRERRERMRTILKAARRQRARLRRG